jgi:hypothetical protein
VQKKLCDLPVLALYINGICHHRSDRTYAIVDVICNRLDCIVLVCACVRACVVRNTSRAGSRFVADPLRQECSVPWFRNVG